MTTASPPARRRRAAGFSTAVRFDAKLLRLLDARARAEGWSRSQVVRRACEIYFGLRPADSVPQEVSA